MLNRCLLNGKEFSAHFSLDVLTSPLEPRNEEREVGINAFILYMYRFTHYQGPSWKKGDSQDLKREISETYLKHGKPFHELTVMEGESVPSSLKSMSKGLRMRK